MGRASGASCVDSQTIAMCDVECGTGPIRDCRVWDNPRPLTVEIPEKQYMALLEVAGAARSFRMVEGRRSHRLFRRGLLDALDRLDKVQGA